MKYTPMALLVSSVLGFSSPSHASGFPVVDVANLLQMVTQYSTMLQEYSQILNQTGIAGNDLVISIQEYEQTLREYQTLLNQVEGLKGKIDRRDYAALERELRRRGLQYAGQQETQNNAIVEARYGRLPNESEYEQLSRQATGGYSDAQQRQYLQAGEAHRQGANIEYYQSRQSALSQDQAQLDQLRLSLGNESELATLQTLVEQNQVIIDQLSLRNDMALSQYAGSAQLDNRVAQGVLKSQQARLERVAQARTEGVDIDERPIR
ncbi:conserved exported hypothetical protein [Vibrio chagasii]|nr:conserved exported hypothetical protein [Vibrio chagasii]